MSKHIVEIWSDIVCPWCWLGKHQFERALAAFSGRADVAVHWRSFQLDPKAPRQYEGTLEDLLAERHGMRRGQADSIHARLASMGRDLGIEYHFDRVRPSNSKDAHRVVHFATSKGNGDAVHERIMRAYFAEGAALGDHAQLAALAAEAGVDAAEVRAMLATDVFAKDVEHDVERAHDLGISGVPCFVMDEKYAVSGAQDVEVFAQFLERARS